MQKGLIVKETSSTLLYSSIKDLTEMSEPNIDRLFGIAAKRQLKKGEIVLKQGQICRKILFVEKGYLQTCYNRDGKEINTDFTFEGGFATNLKSLRTASFSEISIRAGEPAVIYGFDKDELLGLYKTSPEIESFGRKLLEQLLIANEEHASLFKIYSAAERYQYLQTNKPELLQRISLSQLSSYLGLARETLSRIRKNKNSGVL